MPEERKLRTMLQILQKEGYASFERWTPNDATLKESYVEFLKYLKGTVDSEITQRIRVYDLESIRMRQNETVDELVDRIRELARLAQIGDNSDEAIEFEVERRLIKAIPDTDIMLRKELLRQGRDKRVSDLL